MVRRRGVSFVPDVNDCQTATVPEFADDFVRRSGHAAHAIAARAAEIAASKGATSTAGTFAPNC